jgi:hypothetical protein
MLLQMLLLLGVSLRQLLRLLLVLTFHLLFFASLACCCSSRWWFLSFLQSDLQIPEQLDSLVRSGESSTRQVWTISGVLPIPQGADSWSLVR